MAAAVSRSSTARARCRANVSSAEDRSVGGMTGRCERKLGSYIYAVDVPNHPVDTDVYDVLSAARVAA
jgi:hypothetical protein